MAKGPPSETSLKRESAGRYASRDGRFTVEHSSGRWMLVDGASTDDLGLPLVRGPFATLDDARDAIETARSGPAPTSDLAKRIAARPGPKEKGAGVSKRGPDGSKAAAGDPKGATRSQASRPSLAKPEPVTRGPRPEPIELRDYRHGDGEALRALWKEAGLKGLGDDDRSLDEFAKRNPGLLVLATAGKDLAGSALGSWDGRQGWLYHVATATAHRRKGIATRLVRRVEQRLRALGCPQVNLFVCDGTDDAGPFWTAIGYAASTSRPFAKEL
jgi:GNAT superfamily N-acetyltransferase